MENQVSRRQAYSDEERQALQAQLCQYIDECLDVCGKTRGDLHVVHEESQKAIAQISQALKDAGERARAAQL